MVGRLVALNYAPRNERFCHSASDDAKSETVNKRGEHDLKK